MTLYKDLSAFCIRPTASMREAMTCIDRNGRGIALVTDEQGGLLGTVTDGDVRRAMLAEQNLETPVSELLSQKKETGYLEPVVAPAGTAHDELVRLMRQRGVRQMPIVDDSHKVVDLVTMEDLQPETPLPVQAVVMAGGLGTRLRPLTEGLPKPMLPIGGRPLMALIIDGLRQSGIHRVSVTTHYEAEKITDYFGDGSAHGVELSYLPEERPLGTAGGLGLLEPWSEPVLVINGDILTSVDFASMLDYHREHSADLTVAVWKHELEVPYGVVANDGVRVLGVDEKPIYSFFVNAGIYLLEPSVQRYIPQDQRMDMTDLIQCLIDDGRTVVSFLVREYWTDIGLQADYERAPGTTSVGKSSWTGKRVLVTGAGGFIGSHLTERLVALGARASAFVRYDSVGSWGWLDTSSVKDDVEVIADDLRDGDAVRTAVHGADIVFHLAALIGIPYSYHAPLSYVRTNVEGTLNVLQAARAAGVGLVVHTSTSEVYGSARRTPIAEDHPLQGQSPYAASKIGADKLAEAFHLSFGLPVTTVRPFNTFGPRQSARAVIPTIVTQALREPSIRLGNLEATRDFNYVADTVDGFVRAAERSQAIGQVINIGSGREISIGALASTVLGLVGREVPITCDDERVRPDSSEVDRLCADNAKAGEILGWQPQHTLEQGLALTIKWIEANLEEYPSGVYAI